jgi:hypothetical protein
METYLGLIAKAVDRSLDIYLKALSGAPEADSDEGQLLRIGELAKRARVTNSTIRYWTKEGLLEVADVTDAGYQLYAPDMIERINQIRLLQEERYTLQEIKAM